MSYDGTLELYVAKKPKSENEGRKVYGEETRKD